MTKAEYFNDAPIVTPADDRFGIDDFAQAIAKSFRNIESPVGATIAINGPWGSGKSSAVNLIRYHLKEEVESEKLEIVDFGCWWFRGEEALTLAFLQTLNASLQKSLGKKAKQLIPQIGKALLQAGPVLGPAVNLATGGIWGTLTAHSIDFAKRFFSDFESVEKVFQRLSKALEEQGKRFIVIIDDIDRLVPSEALLVFRLVKSVGRLPNVMYLLAFDRELAEKFVTEMYPSEGPHFLEKIIQASFELPLPARDDLNAAALTLIGNLTQPPKDRERLLRFMNVFHDAIVPYLNMPRDLARLSNAITVSWPAVAGEVDVGDYVALEAMRLFEPMLYTAIRGSKQKVCGVRTESHGSEDSKKELEAFVKLASEGRREQTRISPMRLFPRFESMGYSYAFLSEWEAQRRACTQKHFDTYFRMGIGDDTLPIGEIDELIKHSEDEAYVKRAFLEALGTTRKNGKSKVPLLLDELNAHASRVEKNSFRPLISAIFEIADDINRAEDGDRGYSYGNNQIRIHRIIRKLTLDRCGLDERSSVFLAASRISQVGWLVDFTYSAVADHFPREGRQPQPLERCLVKKEDLVELKANTVETIRSAAADGQLIFNRELPRILFAWRDFLGNDGSEVNAWVNEQLKMDTSVSMLAKAFTGESWSQGMGVSGLGDRVAIRSVTAMVNGLEHIMNVHKFRNRLEEMEGSEVLDREIRDDVLIFLEAWRMQERGILDNNDG
jgi:predicted KAP-like P-loop ATPase